MSGLVKAKEYKVEDSNVESLGGEEHRDAVKGVAANAPEWKHWKKYMCQDEKENNIFNKSTGSVRIPPKIAGTRDHVEVWRIEKFKVRFWPKEDHGKFHSGDAYIILHTFQTAVDGGWGKVEHDLYFWLGSESTQDEQGTAAYKTVELDTLLDDVPVQHRECEGHETPEFLRLWSDVVGCGGIRYLEGGVESGFRKVTKEKYVERLFHIKGRGRNVSSKQVPVAITSLNAGDCFILDYENGIIFWSGKEANRMEINKAGAMVASINSERGGKFKPVFVRQDDDDEDIRSFYALLGGDANSTIKTAAEGGADDAPADTKRPKTLHRISDASGSLQMTQEAGEGQISMSKLDSADVFVLDCGTQFFVWVGNGTTQNEKDNAIKLCEDYKKKKGLDARLPVTRILEGKETAAFKKEMGC